MSVRRAALKHLLSNLAYFSRFVIGMELRPYQLGPMMAVVESVISGAGLEFLLVFPRQSGKNEAVAHLMVYLMNLFQRPVAGGSIVFGAIGDGLGRGLRRLEERLDNRLNKGKWGRRSRPTTRTLGSAAAVFLSSHPMAAARGETASILLIIDEMQDQDASHLEATFEPMRAAQNATAVYIGTVRTTSDALWLKKLNLERLQAEDGIRRVFVVGPEEVSGQNEHYGKFLREKVKRFGRQHPIVKSEYYNEPIDGVGGLFGGRRLVLMRGSHERLAVPEAEAIYVATLDIGGQDEAATDVLAALDNPGRDWTVGHIFEVQRRDGGDGTNGDGGLEIIYRAVDVFVNQGGRHFEHNGSEPSVANQVLAWLKHWGVVHLVCDSTGVGQGLTDWLSLRLGAGRVTGFVFTRQSKAGLANNFLAVVETNRFRYFREVKPYDDAWWFFTQCEFCSYEVPPGGRFDRDLRWSVAESVKVDVPGVGRVAVHDDRLVSGALVSVYDSLIAAGDVLIGRAKSVVVKGTDPLGNLGW